MDGSRWTPTMTGAGSMYWSATRFYKAESDHSLQPLTWITKWPHFVMTLMRIGMVLFRRRLNISQFVSPVRTARKGYLLCCWWSSLCGWRGCLWKSFWLADVLFISGRYIFQTQMHRTCCIGTPRGGRWQCTRMQAFRSRHVKRPPTTNNSTYNMKLQVRDSKGKGQQWLKAPELPSPGCLHVKLRLLSLYFSSASRPSTANNRSLQINKSGSRWEIATGCSRNTAK